MTASVGLCSLDQLAPGERGTITAVRGDSRTSRKLMEMGLVRGTVVEVVRYAPLGDPIDLLVRGYHLSLRKSDAALVFVDRAPTP